MTTNLITGGAGFLGSYLVDRLIKAGEEVICIDNLITGNKSNLEKWEGHPRFKFINHDIVYPIELEADMIWHFACPASPIHYQSNPIKTAKTSFLGTYNMLGLAKKSKAKIMYASTSEIYGDPEIHPQVENYRGSVNSIGPRSCYDEGKRIGETLCFDYKRVHNLNIKVIRIFNTYGPRMLPNDGRVVSNFITQALKNENITIYGDGSQTRSFCFVDDLIEGIYNFMSVEKKITGPINLGNPSEITINDLAKLIIEMTNSKSKIIRLELPEDDPKKRKPDISLAKKTLNWSPKTSLEEGLKKTINYFEKC